MSTLTSFAPEVQEECVDAFEPEKPREEVAPTPSVSEAKRRANRLNAKKSTGPKTDIGKKTSRRNSLKHGLTGAGVVMPELEMEPFETQVDKWSEELCPVNDVEQSMVRTLVSASRKLDAGRAIESAMRVDFARRACFSWEHDQTAEILEIAADLAKSPALVVEKLSASFQGCTWLINCWNDLGNALELHGDWTESQRLLVLDLLGVHPANRECSCIFPPDATDDEKHDVVYVAVEDLEMTRDKLTKTNALERQEAMKGNQFDMSPAAQLLRRYDAANSRTYFRLIAYFRDRVAAFRKQAISRRKAAEAAARHAPAPTPAPASKAVESPPVAPEKPAAPVVAARQNLKALLAAIAPDPLLAVAASKPATPAAPAIVPPVVVSRREKRNLKRRR